MGHEIDYAGVLADLEERKAALDAAIAGIRRILGQGLESSDGATSVDPAPNRGGFASSGPLPTRVEAGTFHGLSVSEAAKRYLQIVKQKRKTGDICEALQQGGIESTAKSFYSNVYTTLDRTKDFIRLGSFWALADWYPTHSAAQAAASNASVKGKKRKSKGRRVSASRAKGKGELVEKAKASPKAKQAKAPELTAVLISGNE